VFVSHIGSLAFDGARALYGSLDNNGARVRNGSLILCGAHRQFGWG
jgi:hypothetical protein